MNKLIRQEGGGSGYGLRFCSVLQYLKSRILESGTFYGIDNYRFLAKNDLFKVWTYCEMSQNL